MGKTHVVKRGENLTVIAKKHGTTVEALVALNNIKNKNLIYAGQVLSLPSVDTTPAPAEKDYGAIGKAVENLVERVENLPEFETLVKMLE